ncbi:MAG: [citrate (pro-3S)-lyase] ligase [Treponema sp.]|jgi:[citrate (pro-3S)-lyase] ligase|nr:[citrate (pro-3S)-lyase] ligase [Treponema sp.]
MELRFGSPFSGKNLEQLKQFLRGNGLKYDQRIRFSVCALEGDAVAAAGSLDGRVLKCIAVSPGFQSEGLAAIIVTELVKEAGRRGLFHLFLFTRPEKEELFGNLGFYTVEKTGAVLLMENKWEGITRFVEALPRPPGDISPIGAVIVNCNPFTRGHQYLIESAAARCGALHVFVVSEDLSFFPADLRYELVLKGIAHIPRVYPHPTGPYLISAQTFPDYFFRESADPLDLNMELDLRIFARRFALPLGISRRFVGNEALDPLTAAYNRAMERILPSFGIAVTEIPRLETGGGPVSASRVRELLKKGDLEGTRDLVPPTTFECLKRFQNPNPADSGTAPPGREF